MDLPINQIICGDCLEVMKDWPDGCADLVLTDPPYGLGDRLKGGAGEWSKGFSVAPEWDTEIFKGIEKVIAVATNAVVWGGNYYALPATRGWMIWDKMQSHTSGHAELAWTNIDIPIRTFRKSRVESYGSMDKRHPTQKPLDLMMWCLSFTPEASIILDPFCGSGTTCVAAKLLGRNYIGIDISEEYCQIARDRLKAVDTGVPIKEARKGQLPLWDAPTGLETNIKG